MSNLKLTSNAHNTFPISAPALQRASVTPDFQYLEIEQARKLSALLGSSQPSFSPGELSAIGLMGKAFLSVTQRFLDSSPGTFSGLDDFLQQEMGGRSAELSLSEVVEYFPTSPSYDDPAQKQRYAFGNQSKTPYRHSFYSSLILILSAERNPAIRCRDGVFTDPALRVSPLFIQLLAAVQDFFSNQTEHRFGGLNLVDFLLEPILRYSNSIYDQLLFISSHWRDLLDDDLLRLMMTGLDQIKEEVIPGPLDAKTASDPLGYLSSKYYLDSELVRFSPDRDWMPRVILQAKNVYVWLDQLSREYHTAITRLDQIPEQALSRFSSWGINALWLIGLWERSPASQKIKQICGNPEAVSSAYSLFDYSIADDLGGEGAYEHLLKMAAKFNIRLAADMVPNHMGIDSRWVAEHPDWFLSLDHPPFPGYTYTGMDLSSFPDIGIFLEDHYYDKTDAAVVFKRSDKRAGETRYLYHGNDGTSMPWNDTAQLDFLNPVVREAVIQAVLHVARKFPIIRFDAAMTLSKKHYQRLWFPEPGSGGSIPTRSIFGLSKEQFDDRMPNEFWRELVDRVSQEAPDTLLLAEAFWMMEGYFVRSLGMHRVYNSAFMHMLRDEDNEKYRQLIINTLEYDPQILKRYVNFMNNPDEDTAISQFGSDGKYFGTCLLMATLPGLPMFGHGQIEGLSEKYGMEYKRAYYEESPDSALIGRHKREIFPLLHKRYLFSEVEQFVLYDLTQPDGSTDENVIAYSNRFGDEKALIVFHNKWGDTRGRISRSSLVNGRSADLLSGLGISRSDGDFLLFKDQVTDLEYIRSLQDLQSNGLYLDLGAYCYHAFINFEIVSDQDGVFSQLEKRLGGQGTSDLHYLKLKIKYTPLTKPILALHSLWEAELSPMDSSPKESPTSLQERLRNNSAVPCFSFCDQLSTFFPELEIDRDSAMETILKRVSCASSSLSSHQASDLSPDISLLLAWSFQGLLSPLLGPEVTQSFISVLLEDLAAKKEPYHDLLQKLSLMALLSVHLDDSIADLSGLTQEWFSSPHISEYIGLNDFDGHKWFHKESMVNLISITFNLLYLSLCGKNPPHFSPTPEEESDLIVSYSKAMQAIVRSGYRLDLFTELLAAIARGD